MEKNTGKVREKSGNFVSPEKWEPWSKRKVGTFKPQHNASKDHITVVFNHSMDIKSSQDDTDLFMKQYKAKLSHINY